LSLRTSSRNTACGRISICSAFSPTPRPASAPTT
jgi:hypothetical protein